MRSELFAWHLLLRIEPSEVSCSDLWQILPDAAVADCSPFVPWTTCTAVLNGRPRQMTAKPKPGACGWGLWLEFSNSAKFEELRISTSFSSPFHLNLRKRYKKLWHMSWHEQIPVGVRGSPKKTRQNGHVSIVLWSEASEALSVNETKTKVVDSVDHSLLSQCDLFSSGHLQYVAQLKSGKHVFWYTFHHIPFTGCANLQVCLSCLPSVTGKWVLCSMQSCQFSICRCRIHKVNATWA